MRRDSIRSYIGLAAIAIGAGLPLLALLPFGWLWLWQKGLVLYWFAAALVISLAAFAVRTWLLHRWRTELEAVEKAHADAGQLAGSPREQAARETVERLAREVNPQRIVDYESLTALGVETIEAVAHHMHPDVADPVWSFTVPEALTLLERVSQRLRPLVVENVPLGDRLTVGQVIRLYKWRGLIDVANTAYDIWRVIRLMNPIAAATQEIRERLSKTMYEGLREELARRLAGAYVREVGRAAIDLYSGRLAVPASETESFGASPGATVDSHAPLRFLIAGRSGSGKSSLINGLAEEVQAATDALPQTKTFTGYEVQREGMPPVLLVDSPGLQRIEDHRALVEKAAECDLVIWVAAADRPDRELDRAGLVAIQAHFAAHPHRSAPPIVVVLTHIDRLRPFQEWRPPYNVAEPDSPKAQSIRDAIDAAAGDLGRPVGRIVPVCLSTERGYYNVDLVWAELAEALPEAKSAQLLRRIASAKRGVDWRRLLSQATGAGRLAADVLLRGR
ncbi:MAG: GTPase family protein [Hyphomicrobiaceae bacterium]